MAFCLLILLAISSSIWGAGLAVHPMEQFIRQSRPAYYTAANHSDRSMAIEVEVESWEISEEGEELSEVTEELVVFPRQFVLPPQGSKRIKVVPRERGSVKQEKAYRVTISELPISFEEEVLERNQVYMANAYRTSYYHQPLHPQAQLTVEKSSYEEGLLRFTLVNQGNAHTHLTQAALHLFLEEGERLEITDTKLLSQVAGQNMHAQHKRLFQLDLSHLPYWEKVRAAELKTFTPQERERDVFSLEWR